MRSVLISFFVLFMSLSIIGQTNKGSITGTVTDPKGAPIPGATVTITNNGTNKSTVLMTSDEGSFTASTLDPSLYDVKVESTTFKKALIQRIKVDTASVSTVNVILEVGSISEEVTVQADTQAVNTDAQGFIENKKVAIDAGTSAGKALDTFEKELGVKVITTNNFKAQIEAAKQQQEIPPVE